MYFPAGFLDNKLYSKSRVPPFQGRRIVSARMFFAVLLLTGLVGCATPLVQQSAAVRTVARMEASQIITADGEALPLSVWPALSEPQAIVLALHGFK